MTTQAPGTQGSQTQETYVAVAPNQTMPGAQPIRQLLCLEYQPDTNSYILVNTEVVAVADPATGLVVRPSTSDAQEDLIAVMKAILKSNVAILNELAGDNPGSTSQFSVEDFMREDQEEV